MADNKITTRAANYADWYQDIVNRAGLAENSDVRGCMVIKPNGYALWENMQRALDGLFKEHGHVNAYFPLLIPKSFFQKEEQMAEGFAKECAVVTHYRLRSVGGKIEVDPEAKLEEELIIRPTSETIIWHTYKNWIQSYRDLPLLINQWCNVMRWEMRTRLFLRTSEFLWQEGHTAHATQKEAEDEAMTILMHAYRKFAEEWMAMPVLTGPKSDGQKFPGAVYTLCIEAMMQDGKALQAGTSHFLGQNFAKAFDVTFQNEKGQREHAWATSWGVSTRLIGGLIMTHSDDNGLVTPPRLAPVHVVICPLGKNDAERAPSIAASEKLAAAIRALPRDDFFGYQPLNVKIDTDFQHMPATVSPSGNSAAFPYASRSAPRTSRSKPALSPAATSPARKARPWACRSKAPPRTSKNPARDSSEPLQSRQEIPRRQHEERRHLRPVQANDRRTGIHLGPLGRHPRDRGQDRRRDEGDDSVYSVRPAEGRGQVHGDREAVGGKGGVCEGVLIVK